MKNLKRLKKNTKKKNTKKKVQKGGYVPGENIFIGTLELVSGMVGLGSAMATEVKSIMELPGQLTNAAETVPGQPNVTEQPPAPKTSVPAPTSSVLSGPVPAPEPA